MSARNWFDTYYLQTLLFLLIVLLGVFLLHAMHHADAGSNETIIITFTTTQASGLIGALINQSLKNKNGDSNETKPNVP